MSDLLRGARRLHAYALRSRSTRLPTRLVALALGVGALVATTGLAAAPASADPAVSPGSGKFVIKGAGWGHGHGMSQYGAYGAARKGLTWKQILAFYYPGTALKAMASGTTIKVWITADDDGSLRVLPAAGLKVSDADGHSYTVPTASAYRSWRITRSGSGYRLGWKDADGRYHDQPVSLDASTWSFSTTAKVVKVKMPSSSTREYRGSVALVKHGSGGRTVNKVRLEDYVRSVVPSEMPTSWAADAVRSQAVAARSYAVRTRDDSSASGYDICDTTSCQVYSGLAVTPKGGHRVVHETSRGNAAVKATDSLVLKYQGQVAFTQFASSNGGAMAAGGHDYLVAKLDPYDGVIKSQAWSRTVSVAAVAKAYPSVGTVRKLQITSRDGTGAWGGRVNKIKIIGSKKTATVSGTAFQSKLGMRSSLYHVTKP